MTARRVGAALVGAVLLAWAASFAVAYDPVADVNPSLADAPPAAAHWLGTDHLGRDVALRALHGSRAFVLPGLVAAAVAAVVGGVLGGLAGWTGGRAEPAVRYVFTVVAAVPRLVLILLAATIVGPSPYLLAAAAGVACAPELGSALHARLAGLRRAEFVTALRAHGLPDARILVYHLLWVNCRGLLARQALQAFGFFVIVETTLSYLGGFGVQEPEPSWGNMIAFEFGRPDGNPWAWLGPAAALWLAVLGVTLAAEDLGRREGGEEAHGG